MTLHPKPKAVELVSKTCLRVECLRQTVKLVLTACIIAILLTVDSSLHDLVKCLTSPSILQSTIYPPMPRSIQFPSSSNHGNCSSLKLNESLVLNACQSTPNSPGSLAIFASDSQSYHFDSQELKELQDWIRNCTASTYRESCLITKNPIVASESCYHKSMLDKPIYIVLCFNHNYELDHIIVESLRLSQKESLNMIHFILTCC